EHLLHQAVRVVFRDELDGRHGRAPFFTLDVRPRSPPRARGQTKSASTCGAARTDLVLFRHTPHVNPGPPAHGARAPGAPRAELKRELTMLSVLSAWRRWGGRSGRGGARRQPARRASYRPRLEALEDRCVPSTLAVMKTTDDVNDRGTLRYAVANATSGDTI